LGRPAKKRTYVEAKAAEKGKLQAQLEMHRKKPLEESFKEHVGKIIDRIDPFEAVAILGVTVIVHDVIKETPNLLDRVSKGPAPEDFWGQFVKQMGYAAGGIITPAIQVGAGQAKETVTTLLHTENEAMLWLESYALAYILVHHAGQIFGLLGDTMKSLPLILGFLMGA
jgi:hypothetical protein